LVGLVLWLTNIIGLYQKWKEKEKSYN